MTKVRLLAGILLVVLLGTGWYWAQPARQAIKSWQSRRTAREAMALIDKGDWRNATEKARAAHQLSSAEPEAWRAIARLLAQSGQGASSLEWWKKMEEAGRLTFEDRRAYAAAAFASGDLVTAAAQIDSLLSKQPAGPLPADGLLAGQLAARRGDGLRAIDYAERTLADNRAQPFEILSGAILIISVTAPESPPYLKAWKRIEDLARDAGNIASLNALVFLAEQRAPLAPLPGGEAFSLAQIAATRLLATIPASEVADRLQNHPQAGPSHRLLALRVRAREYPSLAGDFLKEAIARFRNGEDETLLALNSWISAEGQHETVLEVLPIERALQRRELFLQHLDALGALGRFRDVRDLVTRERLPIEPVFRLMYLAIAREKLGESAGAANEWQRALEAADNANKCMALGYYAERTGASAVAEQAYVQAISSTPNLRAAYDARLRIAQAKGETAKASEILSAVVRVWPDDEHARVHEMYLRLLLGAGGEEAEKAVRAGGILVAKEPMNWQARATVALAQLRLGQAVAALQAFSGIKATEHSPVGPLAVRAVALEANGWKEGARNDARTLTAANLLPEERALISPLLRESGE